MELARATEMQVLKLRTNMLLYFQRLLIGSETEVFNTGSKNMSMEMVGGEVHDLPQRNVQFCEDVVLLPPVQDEHP